MLLPLHLASMVTICIYIGAIVHLYYILYDASTKHQGYKEWLQQTSTPNSSVSPCGWKNLSKYFENAITLKEVKIELPSN